MAKKPTTKAKPKRTRNRRDVAQHFGVTERAVGYWQKESWWQPEFRTTAGYDIAAIEAARAANARPTDLTETRHKLRVHREKTELDIKLAELRARQRREEKELGNLLPADVYAEYSRELLGMVRAGLDELPYRLSREVPAKLRKFVYVAPARIKKERDAAPFQRMVAKLIADIEAWLSADPAEETAK